METENNGEIRDEGGRFGKGNPGKPKGAVTKVSVKVKEAIVDFLERNTDKIQGDFDKLKPRERLQFIADILPYATPKLQSIQSEVDQNITGGITIKWEEPDLSDRQGKGSDGDV